AAPAMSTAGAPPVRSGVPAGHGRRARPVVGMLTKDLLEYAAEQWLGVVDATRAGGCDLVCFCGGALEIPGNPARSNAIYDLVSGEALDGLIVWTSVLAIDAGPERMAEFGRRFASLPVVSVEQRLGDAPVVAMENRQGMRAAVNHLIEVHGRRRIAFIRGPANHAGAQERYAGYRAALADHGLVEHPGLVSAQPSSWLPEAAAELVTGMLRQQVPPDGIAAANDDFAVAAL